MTTLSSPRSTSGPRFPESERVAGGWCSRQLARRTRRCSGRRGLSLFHVLSRLFPPPLSWVVRPSMTHWNWRHGILAAAIWIGIFAWITIRGLWKPGLLLRFAPEQGIHPRGLAILFVFYALTGLLVFWLFAKPSKPSKRGAATVQQKLPSEKDTQTFLPSLEPQEPPK